MVSVALTCTLAAESVSSMVQPGSSHTSSVRRLSMSACCLAAVKLSSVSATVNWSCTTVYVVVTTARSGLTGGKRSSSGGAGGIEGGGTCGGTSGGSGGVEGCKGKL
eukprot:6301932-Prymnesium_polylepis.1